ncbi:UAA transporter [Cladochytrium tenue]|nr:UAA transporter [Cladochytrium tenue]
MATSHQPLLLALQQQPPPSKPRLGFSPQLATIPPPASSNPTSPTSASSTPSLPQPPANALLRLLESPTILVAIYFGLNLGITIYNKAVLKLVHFNFPWLLTAIHTLFSWAGASLFVEPPEPPPEWAAAAAAADPAGPQDFSSGAAADLKPSPVLPLHHRPDHPPARSPLHHHHHPAVRALLRLVIWPLRAGAAALRSATRLIKSSVSSSSSSAPTAAPSSALREQLAVAAFSVLYTVNIAVSNVSLSMVSLPFHQIVRSTNPAVTLALERVLLGKRMTGWDTYASLALVIFGVALATLGEYEFTTAGLATTLLGVLLSSLKGIATNVLVTKRPRAAAASASTSGPGAALELLHRMSGPACLQCLAVSWATGELAAYRRFAADLAASPGGGYRAVAALFVVLALNGGLAFLLNLASFAANRSVGALAMTVAGNVKQSLAILVSVWTFGYVISAVNGAAPSGWRAAAAPLPATTASAAAAAATAAAVPASQAACVEPPARTDASQDPGAAG